MAVRAGNFGAVDVKQTSESIRRRPVSISVDDLRSSDFDVVEFYKNHEAVSSALGIDLDATIELARALPLGLRHEEHRDMRRHLARVLALGQRRLLPALPDLVRDHFAVLDKPGRHDLLTGACKPFVNKCIALLSGTALDPVQFDALSDIFDPGIGFRKRKQLEVRTKRLLEDARRQSSSDDPADAAYALAVAVMGRDALLGSLVFSLSAYLKTIRGTQINSGQFSAVPSDTGVPYVWRVGVGAKTEGETFECHLGQLVGADDSARMKLFGMGAHTCLGKTHSLKIFEAMSDFLAQRTLTVKDVASSAIDKHVLKIPASFEIELE